MQGFSKTNTLNLIIDIGNNSAKYYLFSGNQIVLHSRRANDSFGILKEWNNEFNIKKAIVSSVIGLSDKVKAEFEVLDCPIIWFDSRTSTPLTIKYRTPETLGSDRLAAAVGAWDRTPGHNLLIIDSGSAITFDFVDHNGNYLGGNIAPGIKMRLKALHDYTACLPNIEKDGEVPAIGYNTETAIRSGVIRGISHEIEGYIEDFKEKYGDVFVFLTGGDEKTLINHIKSRIFADKYLVAKGLNRILQEHSNE